MTDLRVAEIAAEDRHAKIATLLHEPWPLVVWVAMAGWSAALFATVRSDFANFRLGRFDFGNMVQAVWSTADGRPLEVTDGTGDQIVRLSSHVDPILVLLAPLWLVFPTPLMVAAVQITACALGALPVFWLARRHLGSERAAGFLALAYLTYPWLVWTALDAMHPVTLAIPLLLYAIWFLETGRLWSFALTAILVAATGELMGLPIAALGLWYWASRGKRWHGIGIAVAGVVWTTLALKVVIPAYRGDESRFYAHYEHVGGSPEGVIRTAVTDPGAIASALFSLDDLLYVLLLAAPLLGMFIFAPIMAIGALPQLVANGLADHWAFTDPRQHYVGAVIPFLFAATIFALARLQDDRRLRIAGAIFIMCAAWLVILVVGRVPGRSPDDTTSFHAAFPAAHVVALRDAIALVPDDASVTATSRAGSQLSARRYVYSVPTLGRADWIVVDARDPWMLDPGAPRGDLYPERLRVFVSRIRESAVWVNAFERDDVVVFRRVTGRGRDGRER